MSGEVEGMSDRRLVEHARAVVEEMATRLEEYATEFDNVSRVLMGEVESDAVGECGKCGTLLFSEGDACACDMFDGLD